MTHLPQPFDLARTLLALGRAQRRARERRAARETLRRALAIFEELGAAAVGGEGQSGARPHRRPRCEPGRPHALPSSVWRSWSPRARRTSEVAAELVVSVHTVESTLTQVYRKLGVRSRTELARSYREQA